MYCPTCGRDWPDDKWTPMRPAFVDGRWRRVRNCRQCNVIVAVPEAVQ